MRICYVCFPSCFEGSHFLNNVAQSLRIHDRFLWAGFWPRMPDSWQFSLAPSMGCPIWNCCEYLLVFICTQNHILIETKKYFLKIHSPVTTTNFTYLTAGTWVKVFSSQAFLQGFSRHYKKSSACKINLLAVVLFVCGWILFQGTCFYFFWLNLIFLRQVILVTQLLRTPLLCYLCLLGFLLYKNCK